MPPAVVIRVYGTSQVLTAHSLSITGNAGPPSLGLSMGHILPLFARIGADAAVRAGATDVALIPAAVARGRHLFGRELALDVGGIEPPLRLRLEALLRDLR